MNYIINYYLDFRNYNEINKIFYVFLRFYIYEGGG